MMAEFLGKEPGYCRGRGGSMHIADPDSGNLGANAIVGVSLALARAAAGAAGIPLYRYLNSNAHVIPVPLFNLINGGKHASNDLEVQEFIIVPIGAESFSHALQIGTEVIFELRDLIISKYGKIAVNTGDEGGFAPDLDSNREALDLLMEAISQAGYKPGDEIGLALDVAAPQRQLGLQRRNWMHLAGAPQGFGPGLG